MNKKEVAEIRGQFSPIYQPFTWICGCYVDGGKERKAGISQAFLSLPEEEIYKYADIFKKTLSGKLGKNLINLAYPENLTGSQEFFRQIRDGRLRDTDLTDDLFDAIIGNYDYPGSYYIILAHGVYDIPGKGADNAEMFDASEDVYEFLICAICPAKLSKPGLTYDADSGKIENRVRDWVIDVPSHGFLFPAFNDRNADLSGCLYYSKKPDNMQREFVRRVLGCPMDMEPDEQKQAFDQVIATAAGGLRNLLNIHENLALLKAERDWSAQPWEMDKAEAERLLRDSVGEEAVEGFNEAWVNCIGEKGTLAGENIGSRKVSITYGAAEIKIDADHTNGIREQVIDGRKYLLIPAGGTAAVNGVEVKN